MHPALFDRSSACWWTMANVEQADGLCNTTLTNGSGLFCGHPAGWGTDHTGFGRCKFHGGATKNGRKNGARLRAQGEFGSLLAECGVELSGRPGPEALNDARERCGAMVMALGLLVDELDTDSDWKFDDSFDDKGKRDRWVLVEKLGLVGPGASGEQMMNAIVRAYGDWLDRLARVEKIAADLGLAERVVKLNEDAGAAMVRVLEAVAVELGWDSDQVRPAVARHLRAVADDEAAS